MDVRFDKNNINYSYDDYRKEIRTILERNNKRIKISEVLKKCGISKGNYYIFMKGGREYKNGFVSTLSYTKLDHLLAELRKYDVSLTNRNRMKNMTDEELAEFISNHFTNNPDSKFINILRWLKSSE